MSGNKKILELEVATDLTGASFVIAKNGLNERVPTDDLIEFLGINDLESIVADGDKGDIVVGSTGTTWTIDPAVLSTFGRTLIDDATAGAALTTLGVSAFAQTILDDAAAGDVLTTLGVSAFIQTLLNDADVGTAQTTLGISTFVKTLIDDASAAAFMTTLGITANGQSLITAANYAAMRALLDLEAGTDFYSISAANAAFQPIDADLTAIAALSGTNSIYYRSAASTWTAVTVAASLSFAAGSLAVATDGVDNTMLANMAQTTIKGRASGAGTGDPTDLTEDQVKTILGISTSAFMDAVIGSATRALLLSNSSIVISLGTIADDTAVSFSIGTGAFGGFILLSENTSANSMITLARATAAGIGITMALDVTASYTVNNSYTAALTGTTGVDASMNLGVDDAGNYYVENRTGVSRSMWATILK